MITKNYKPTEDDKQFAKDLSEVLVGSAKEKRGVTRHSNFDRTPEEDLIIDTLHCKDCPVDEATTYMTLNSSLDEENEEVTLEDRIELISAAKSVFTDYENILTGLSQLIAINGWKLKDGLVIQNVLKDSSWKVEHAFITKPFLWSDLKGKYKVNGSELHLWQVIPIHESERDTAKEANSFVHKLKEAGLDIFDLNRTSL